MQKMNNLFTTIMIFNSIISIYANTITNNNNNPSSSSSSSQSSIYDILSTHGLPVGLLPIGISNFSLDPASGRFEIHLPQSCAAQFETHVWYDRSVSGTLNYGQISEISGVAAQELFLWFAVKEIRVDIPSSGLIYFDVGVVSKQFSLSFFETSRDCTITDGVPSLSYLSSLPSRDIVPLDGDRQRNLEHLSRKFIKERYPRSIDRAVS